MRRARRRKSSAKKKLLRPGKPLRTQIEHDDLGSMLFWDRPAAAKRRWRA